MRLPPLALSLCFAVLLAACTKPTDHVIPADMSTWDKDLAPIAAKLSEEDRRTLGAYLFRMKLVETFSKGQDGQVPIGTTIGQAIAAQKKWEEEKAAAEAVAKAEAERKEVEARALAAKMEAERATLLKQFNDAVTVTLLSKQQLPSDFRAGRYQAEQVFVVGIENKGDKPLVGVAGRITFIDVFDKEVGGVSMKIDEAIRAGATLRWTGSRNYNEFLAEHKAVWNLEPGKFTTRFTPSMLVFADGSRLQMPE